MAKEKNIIESWHGRHFNILGEEYTFIAESKNEEEVFIKGEAIAFADFYKKRIAFDKEREENNFEDALKETIRHELLHCFFYESGLDANSGETDSWARNEEMVDWFAIQSPKIFKLFEENDLL